MHFCQDELNVMLCSLPFIGIGIHYLRAKFGLRRKHKHGDCVVFNGMHVTPANDPRIR